MMFRIGYFADGPWSHETFNKIIQNKNIKISFICVRFDSKDKILKKLSENYKIDYLKHEDVNSEEFLKMVSIYDCDLFVSMSFNQIFKKEIINLPKYKIINCHAGKLPFYRGRNVLNWVLINDEKEFGITVHYIDEGIDTGDIIMQRVFPITDSDNYETLLSIAYKECANILYETLLLFIEKREIYTIKQIEIDSLGFYCIGRQTGDENISWNTNSRDIFNFVRAICYPGPKARAFLNGKEMKINKVAFLNDASNYKGIPGSILRKTSKGFYVKTKDTFIEVLEYEYDGKILIGDRFE